MTTRATKVFDEASSSLPSSIQPGNTAVILADYQNFIVSRAGEHGPAVVEVAKGLRDWAMEMKIPVFHATVDIKRPPVPTSKISDRWPQYEQKFRGNPELGDEISELTNRTSMTIDDNRTSTKPVPTSETNSIFESSFLRTPGVVSALLSDGIRDVLAEKGTRSLIIAGLSTSGCVLSTVRAATDEGYMVTVVEDACWDPVPGLHEMLVKNVFPTTAYVAKLSEVREMWAIGA